MSDAVVFLSVGDLAELHRNAFALIEEGLKAPRCTTLERDAPSMVRAPARWVRAQRARR